MGDKNREEVLRHLKNSYLGPLNGEYETVGTRPNHTYIVGTVFPQPQKMDDTPDTFENSEELEIDEHDDPVIETSNAWKPASTAMSFIVNAEELECSLSYATYEPQQNTTSQRKEWHRSPHHHIGLRLATDARSWMPTSNGRGSHVLITSRWRSFGEHWLVTVAVQNTLETLDENGNAPTEDCLYQVRLGAKSIGGRILPYRTAESFNLSPEDEELALRYRDKEVYAVGHGMSVDWAVSGSGVEVFTEPLPIYEVPVLEARESEAQVFGLKFLETIDQQADDVVKALEAFVLDYRTWSLDQEETLEGLSLYQAAGRRIVERQNTATLRMERGVRALASNALLRTAFSLAMKGMREQMLQSKFSRSSGSSSCRPQHFDDANEPRWHPFQLGFILLSLESAILDEDPSRDIVDLIWFPTGGGKTEAYLGLTAIVMFWRRLTRGVKGGGTAAITRYTLRLLTTQQFQRAATLICALEILRDTDHRAQGMVEFSIGLWVGNETTPGTEKQAAEQLRQTLKMAEPDNPFQMVVCPWCGHPMMPRERSSNPRDYGASIMGGHVLLRCPSTSCPFTNELPVEVIDERIYRNPPTILLATVDKFARLTFEPQAGRLLGYGLHDGPTLIIQDELHLLSGPLGTTVGIFETAVSGIIGSAGSRPKIVASTATIRAAEEQVRGLMARDVALFPPSGLTEDNSYFAVPNVNKPGRTYVGLMPHAFTQSTAVVQSLTPLLEAPYRLTNDTDEDLDSYWTVVAYHNSLRELGRTVTLVNDDIRSRLIARSSKATDNQDRRLLAPDGLVELTGQVPASELPKSLSRLEENFRNPGAVDVVASTNMLSVGIDVPRLASMLMNGQPKTTSEYIQATSRVGRSRVPGIIVTLYRATKPRDRSHYETFRSYHQALYRHVEPTSVTPWSRASRDRTLASVVVALVRQTTQWSENDQARDFEADGQLVQDAIDHICSTVALADPREKASLKEEVTRLVRRWANLASEARSSQHDFPYSSQDRETPGLTRSFTQDKAGWPVINSMRNVDRSVAIVVKGERAAK